MVSANKLLITDHEIFRDLASDTNASLEKILQSRIVPSGAVLFHEGDAVDGFYILVAGMLGIQRVSLEGDLQLLSILGPGELAGEMALFNNHKRSASALALSECRLGFIERHAFFKFSDQNPQVYRAMLDVLAQRFCALSFAIAQNQFLSVSGQLAAALVKLADHIGRKNGESSVYIPYRITHRELASMIGVARENVSREINQMKRRELLSIEEGHFNLQKMDDLRELALV